MPTELATHDVMLGVPVPSGAPASARTGGDARRVSEVDFAIAAYREDGSWTVTPLPWRVAEHLEGVVTALHQLPAEGGAVAMVSIGDETFLLVRVCGARVRLLVADAAAAEVCRLGREAVDMLADEGGDLVLDAEDVPWVGDLGLLEDLGIASVELRSLCDDDEAFPDELLGLVAGHLGVGPAFARALDGVV